MSGQPKPKRDHISIAYEDENTVPIPKQSQNTTSPVIYQYKDIAVIPSPGDNCGIVTRNVHKGTLVVFPNSPIPVSLPHTVLEAHRICTEPIPKGTALLSWGLPFGFSIRDIIPGDYIMNDSMLNSLKIRNLDFTLPEDPNFEDKLESLRLDVSKFQSFQPTPRLDNPVLRINGYLREGSRGAGTRNFVVVLGLTSLVGSFVRLLEQEFKGSGAKVIPKVDLGLFKNIDGVTSVSHTEGGTRLTPINNLKFIMRTLGGWVVHPNIGGLLLVADETDVAFTKSNSDSEHTLLTLTNFMNFLKTNNYSLDNVHHRVLSLTGNFKADLKEGLEKLKELLPLANNYQRQELPATYLKIAMQCGGSDAFSGVSANPLAGWSVKEIIKNGGSANLAETDELMGAEPYIVKGCPNLEIAEKFLRQVEWFKNYASWHGHTAETNPSGGNKFRGLYNIALKSLGAAMKKNPDVSLDDVIDYSERLTTQGYNFMNSPGNDLESIAGQVASGCNLIYFTTGNGSVTNFPFVPTIKIVTTSGRFRLLHKDMDINAGEYLDGTPFDVLGKKLLDYTIDITNGKKSIGELAGHSQVSMWRNWSQVDSSKLKQLTERPESLPGNSLIDPKKKNFPFPAKFSDLHWKGIYGSNHKRTVTNHIGLILPTSLCSSQVALQITNKLNLFWNHGVDEKVKSVLSRFVTLPHTEGCGNSSGLNEIMFRRTMLGHLIHPTVRYGLLLEHGCEKTHNDYMSVQLKEMGVSLNQFGWASVQLDGGIESVTKKVMEWFQDKITKDSALPGEIISAGLDELRVGIVIPPTSKISLCMSKCLGYISANIVDKGGMITLLQNSPLLQNWKFLTTIDQSGSITTPVTPTLGYGQTPKILTGFHVMETVTDHHVENITGLGSSGVEVILYISEQDYKPVQTHPVIPIIQITTQLKGKPTHPQSSLTHPQSSLTHPQSSLTHPQSSLTYPQSSLTHPQSSLEDFDLVIMDSGEEDEVRSIDWGKEIMEVILRVASREYVPKLSVNCDFQISRDSLGIST